MIKVGVIGATGYAGAELMRLLHMHREVSSVVASSVTYSGTPFSDVYQNFSSIDDNCCTSVDIDTLSKECDVIFLSLPHGISSKMVSQEILNRSIIIDLGADYRLKDIDVYTSWYKSEHYSPSLLEKAVYGLSELYREQIKQTRLIANPGCYTTCSILSLGPLLQYNLIDETSIIIDAKSGVSGAGRKEQLSTLFGEVNESIKAYSVASHRHTPEIEQELSFIHTHGKSSSSIAISFTPHLIPMNRGILTTSYASLKKGVTVQDVAHAYSEMYGKEKFIRLKKGKELPETRFVKGSNYVDINYVIDERVNRIVVVGALDNLMKGAASQAVQNMNIVCGFEEDEGLKMIPFFPA
ncbi:MAG: N-acetyl-gamma-glutamyl-phosphate reductase [Spirochaetia bacterium]|nr:N-acetyl-gamma-glutamyl-phosphate reductase [Spirochaetia bacterium]